MGGARVNGMCNNAAVKYGGDYYAHYPPEMVPFLPPHPRNAFFVHLDFVGEMAKRSFFAGAVLNSFQDDLFHAEKVLSSRGLRSSLVAY